MDGVAVAAADADNHAALASTENSRHCSCQLLLLLLVHRAGGLPH